MPAAPWQLLTLNLSFKNLVMEKQPIQHPPTLPTPKATHPTPFDTVGVEQIVCMAPEVQGGRERGPG